MNVSAFSRFNFYNKDLKLEYLQDIESEKSAITIAYGLQKAADTEEFYKTDLYEFNLKQIELVLKDINPASISSAKSYLSQIKGYINWTIRHGYRRSNINILDGIGEEWLSRVVTKKKKFISEMELRSIEDGLANYQDSVILNLAFHGVTGKDLYEMSYLKYHYLHSDKLEIHQEDGNVRIIDVNDRTVHLINGAFREDEYKKKNGMAEGNNPVEKLQDTEYVLKNTNRKNVAADIVSKFTIMRRLRLIKDLWQLPMLSIKNLEKSGMINYAYELSKESGQFGNEEFELVAKKYNLATFTGENGKEYYLKASYRDVLNSKNVKELYGVEITFDF